MQLENIPLFAALTTRMRWLHERQSVIAANVANADTPGYEAKDLAEPDFYTLLRQSRGRLSANQTHPGHLSNSVSERRFRPETDGGGGFDVSPTGNTVVLEEEMLKVAETSASYQLVSSLYGKHISMLKSVLGRGR